MSWFTCTVVEEVESIWRINAKNKEEAFKKYNQRLNKPTKKITYIGHGIQVKQDKPKTFK